MEDGKKRMQLALKGSWRREGKKNERPQEAVGMRGGNERIYRIFITPEAFCVGL